MRMRRTASRAVRRNALRLGVMPQLRRINPRVEEALCRAAAHAAEAAKLLRAQAEERLCGRWRRTPYGAFWLTERMDADAVRLLAEKAGAPALDEAQTARACALSPGEETALAGGWRALRTARRLHLIARVARYEAGGTPFSCTLCAPGETGDGMRCQVFDASQLAGAAFRARRDGDVFSLLNLQGEQKLKKTMQDAKIDRPFRDLLPVLARGNRVLWVVGLKPSGDAGRDGTDAANGYGSLHGRSPVGDCVSGGGITKAQWGKCNAESRNIVAVSGLGARAVDPGTDRSAP